MRISSPFEQIGFHPTQSDFYPTREIRIGHLSESDNRNRTPTPIGQARCRKPLGRSRTTPIRICPTRNRTNPSRSRTNSEWSRTRLRAKGARSESLVRFELCSIRLGQIPLHDLAMFITVSGVFEPTNLLKLEFEGCCTKSKQCKRFS